MDNMSSIIKSMEKYKGKERQHLIADYYYETTDTDSLVKMPPSFFGELLANEEDSICKWFEIKAIGYLKADEYVDEILSIIMAPDVNFEGGSSLHLIAAKAMGDFGEIVIPKLIKAWATASGETRIALIDSLGEMRCEEAAEALESILGGLNTKEFVYASLALSKCKAKGNDILKKIFEEADRPSKLIIIDALAGSVDNDVFLNEVSVKHPDVFSDALTINSERILQFKNRTIG